MYSKEGEDAILTWVKSFPFGSEVTSLEELANGSIMAKILNRLVFWLVHFYGQRNLVIFHHISSIYNLSSFSPMKMRGLILWSHLRILIETTHMVEQKSKTKKGSIQNSSVKPNLSIDWSQPIVEMLIFVSSMQPRLLNVSLNIIEIASNERVFMVTFWDGPFQLAHFRLPIFWIKRTFESDPISWLKDHKYPF